MAKKKDKPQVINNIQELNLEIDYDKLAEAMVKAQEKSENEANRKKFTSGTFAIIISLAFRGVAIFGWLIALVTPIAIINMAKSFVWNEVNVVIGNVFSIASTLATRCAAACSRTATRWPTMPDVPFIRSRTSTIPSLRAMRAAPCAVAMAPSQTACFRSIVTTAARGFSTIRPAA